MFCWRFLLHMKLWQSFENQSRGGIRVWFSIYIDRGKPQKQHEYLWYNLLHPPVFLIWNIEILCFPCICLWFFLYLDDSYTVTQYMKTRVCRRHSITFEMIWGYWKSLTGTGLEIASLLMPMYSKHV